MGPVFGKIMHKQMALAEGLLMKYETVPAPLLPALAACPGMGGGSHGAIDFLH
jgi:hypothetical protein